MNEENRLKIQTLEAYLSGLVLVMTSMNEMNLSEEQLEKCVETVEAAMDESFKLVQDYLEGFDYHLDLILPGKTTKISFKRIQEEMKKSLADINTKVCNRNIRQLPRDHE